jgi:hypothetical protein
MDFQNIYYALKSEEKRANPWQLDKKVVPLHPQFARAIREVHIHNV